MTTKHDSQQGQQQGKNVRDPAHPDDERQRQQEEQKRRQQGEMKRPGEANQDPDREFPRENEKNQGDQARREGTHERQDQGNQGRR